MYGKRFCGDSIRWCLTILLAGALCAMTACRPKPETPAEQDQRLKDQAAQATVDIKRGAKQAPQKPRSRQPLRDANWAPLLLVSTRVSMRSREAASPAPDGSI